MQVAVFNAKDYDREFLGPAFKEQGLEPIFLEPRLYELTAAMANDYRAVCVFVNDDLNRDVVHRLADSGCELIALRCAGFNNVDLGAARERGVEVVRVPEYSPNAVAEHTFGLILALNRRIYRAHNRVREGNFSLDGLLGFDLCEATIGIVGTGKIGACVARIAGGFGCRTLLYDPRPNAELEDRGEYTSLERLLELSDIVTLHCPLNDQTHHLINKAALSKMKSEAMLINTSRGGLVDTKAVILALKRQQLGALGLDVYEEEAELFFEDRSETILHDDTFSRLLTFPNVLITSHQAFFTKNALTQIASTTASSIAAWRDNRQLPEPVRCSC